MDRGLDKLTETYSSPDITSEAANFECYICFERAKEPIVTSCGHLYCWPCLYQWLRLHSHYHECPVCKSVVHYEKAIPIYGRGKTNSDPRSKFPNICIPFPQMDYNPSNEPDPMSFMPMAVARVGHMALSTIFGALPGIFNRFQMHGFRVYGTTSSSIKEIMLVLFVIIIRGFWNGNQLLRKLFLQFLDALCCYCL